MPTLLVIASTVVQISQHQFLSDILALLAAHQQCLKQPSIHVYLKRLKEEHSYYCRHFGST